MRHFTVSLFSFPSLAQYIESPDVEKEVKRLLSTDAEAVSVRILLGEKKAHVGDRTLCVTWGLWKGETSSALCGRERLGDKHTRGTEVLELHLCFVQSSLFLQGDLPCGLWY